MSLSISNKGLIKITILEVRHSANFYARRRFFKVNYGARGDTLSKAGAKTRLSNQEFSTWKSLNGF
jgi:hypothetical protein